MKKNHEIKHNHQKGVTLVEVLVTVIVLAIGMLGLAGMQNTSIKFSYDSYLRTQASFLANDIMDRIRANPDVIYQLALTDLPSSTSCLSTSVGAGVDCSALNMLNADLFEWTSYANEIFPEAKLEISSDDGRYAIRIIWEDRYDADLLDGEAKQFIFNFDVR